MDATPAQFGVYMTTTTIAVGLFAYLILQFADYVDDLTVPCQHSTDIVDGRCSCVGTPFTGTFCQTSECENGILADVAVTTPFVKTSYGCRCDGSWWGYLCDVCTSTLCKQKSPCMEAESAGSLYFGDRCSRYCSANLTRQTRYLSSDPDSLEYRRIENSGGRGVHCSGHGDCSDQGCVCDEDYYPSSDGISACEATCPSVDPTRPEETKCNRPYGSCVQENGVTFCACRDGYVGPACEYRCPNSCSGAGICVFKEGGINVECLCDEGFVSDDCSQKCPSSDSFTCSGHGSCQAGVEKASCTCSGGWELDDCSCTPPITCTGHGQCSNDGCICTGNFDGGRCDICKPTFLGDECQYECVEDMCNEGVCAIQDETLVCRCPYGFDDSTNCSQCTEYFYPLMESRFVGRCSQYVDNNTCFNNGMPNENYSDQDQHKCACDGNFDPASDCLNCKEDYYPEGVCNVHCTRDTCLNGGTCNVDTGGCNCEEGFAGANCDSTCGSSCNNGRCVANNLVDTIAFSCVCDENFYGEQCDITCPMHDNQVCNSAGTCSAKKLTAASAQCRLDSECDQFSAYGTPHCHKPLSPSRTADLIYGCTGEISIDLYDAQETGTRDPFYYITADDMYLYPVFHSPATDVLDQLLVRTVEEKSLFLLDFFEDEPIYHDQLTCKNIPSATSCDIVIGCTWTDEFCDFEMQGVDQFDWCNGVLSFGDPRDCATLDTKGCNVDLCADPMSQNPICNGKPSHIIESWEQRHFYEHALVQPSLILAPEKDPFTLNVVGDMPQLCYFIGQLPWVHRTFAPIVSDVPVDETTIINYQGFKVCEDSANTWQQALALKNENCIIEEDVDALYSARLRPRDMCEDIRTMTSLNFTGCAPGFKGSWVKPGNGEYQAKATHLEFWYNSPSDTNTGPRIIFRDDDTTIAGALMIDLRVYLNKYDPTDFIAHCPLGEDNCNRLIDRNRWYPIHLFFENDQMTLRMENTDDLTVAVGTWTFFEIVGLSDELIHQLVLYDDEGCAPLYRKAELPYGVTSETNAVQLCAEYEALEEPDDTFDFEEYCNFTKTLQEYSGFAERSDTQQCAALLDQIYNTTCEQELEGVCQTLGPDAVSKVAYCEDRTDYYNADNTVGVPPDVSPKCQFTTEEWTSHCTDIKEKTLQGTCAVAQCECNFNQQYALGGDACHLTCPMHEETQSPCGIAAGLGKCVERENAIQMSDSKTGECDCTFKDADGDRGCFVECRNENCNLNETERITVRSFECTSELSKFDTTFVRRAGHCVPQATGEDECECEQCAGYMALGEGNCTSCSAITDGDVLLFEKTPIQLGTDNMTEAECPRLTTNFRNGVCQVFFDNLEIKELDIPEAHCITSYYDGCLVNGTEEIECNRTEYDGCRIYGTEQHIPICDVVFTAGSCNSGTGQCICQTPLTSKQIQTQIMIFGDVLRSQNDVYFGTHKRLNMMQGLGAYLKNHVLYKGEPIETVTDALREDFRRNVGGDDFACDNPTYARPYEFCDLENEIICTEGYACVVNMCQHSTVEDLVELTYSPANCLYDNMIRSSISKRSPFSGMDCDNQCPGTTESDFPDDYLGCSGHGSCTRGTCNCDNAAFLVQYVKGERVENPVTGAISDYQLVSMPTNAMTGWRGIGCEKQCPGYDTKTFDHRQTCSGHGECTQNARCICESGWTGREDNGCVLQCPATEEAPLNECSSHGTCEIQMIGPIFGDTVEETIALNEDIEDAFRQSELCTDNFWLEMMSEDYYSADGKLVPGDYMSKDYFYNNGRFEWDGVAYIAEISIVFGDRHTYTFTVDDEHMFLPNHTVPIPVNHRMFVEMDEHVWKIGVSLNGTSVLHRQVVQVSYPYRLKIKITGGEIIHLRNAVGVWDGAANYDVQDQLRMLQPIQSCTDIGWADMNNADYGSNSEYMCFYGSINCTIRYLDPSTFNCQRGSLFHVDADCHHNIKNAFTWTRPTVEVNQRYNKETTTQKIYEQTATVYTNFRYKLATCRCLPGWSGFDCATCERGVGGSTCSLDCPTFNGRVCDNRGICQWGSLNGLGDDFFDASCVCGLYEDTDNTRFALDAAGFSLYEGDDWIFRVPDQVERFDITLSYFEDRKTCTCQEGWVGLQCSQSKPSCLFAGEPDPDDDANCKCKFPILDPLQSCCPSGFFYDRSVARLPDYFTASMVLYTDLPERLSIFPDMMISDQQQIQQRCKVAMQARDFRLTTSVPVSTRMMDNGHAAPGACVNRADSQSYSNLKEQGVFNQNSPGLPGMKQSGTNYDSTPTVLLTLGLTYHDSVLQCAKGCTGWTAIVLREPLSEEFPYGCQCLGESIQDMGCGTDTTVTVCTTTTISTCKASNTGNFFYLPIAIATYNLYTEEGSSVNNRIDLDPLDGELAILSYDETWEIATNQTVCQGNGIREGNYNPLGNTGYGCTGAAYPGCEEVFAPEPPVGELYVYGFDTVQISHRPERDDYNNPLEQVIIDTRTNRTDILQVCDGNCRTDADCAGSLVCFVRQLGDPLPVQCVEGDYTYGPDEDVYTEDYGPFAYNFCIDSSVSVDTTFEYTEIRTGHDEFIDFFNDYHTVCTECRTRADKDTFYNIFDNFEPVDDFFVAADTFGICAHTDLLQGVTQSQCVGDATVDPTFSFEINPPPGCSTHIPGDVSTATNIWRPLDHVQSNILYNPGSEYREFEREVFQMTSSDPVSATMAATGGAYPGICVSTTGKFTHEQVGVDDSTPTVLLTFGLTYSESVLQCRHECTDWSAVVLREPIDENSPYGCQCLDMTIGEMGGCCANGYTCTKDTAYYCNMKQCSPSTRPSGDMSCCEYDRSCICVNNCQSKDDERCSENNDGAWYGRPTPTVCPSMPGGDGCTNYFFLPSAIATYNVRIEATGELYGSTSWISDEQNDAWYEIWLDNPTMIAGVKVQPAFGGMNYVKEWSFEYALDAAQTDQFYAASAVDNENVFTAQTYYKYGEGFKEWKSFSTAEIPHQKLWLGTVQASRCQFPLRHLTRDECISVTAMYDDIGYAGGNGNWYMTGCSQFQGGDLFWNPPELNGDHGHHRQVCIEDAETFTFDTPVMAKVVRFKPGQFEGAIAARMALVKGKTGQRVCELDPAASIVRPIEADPLDPNPGSAQLYYENNIPRCAGDCDSDSQCAPGLKCMQRNTGEPGPVQCKGAFYVDYDYCYNPNIEVQMPFINRPCVCPRGSYFMVENHKLLSVTTHPQRVAPPRLSLTKAPDHIHYLTGLNTSHVTNFVYDTELSVVNMCDMCIPGKHAIQDTNRPTEVTCVNCPGGKYSNLSPCLFCPAGQYGTQEGMSSCNECPSGYFQDLKGQGSCKVCGALGYTVAETNDAYKERILVDVEIIQEGYYCNPHSQPIDISSGHTYHKFDTNAAVAYGKRLASSHDYYHEDLEVECGIRCWNDNGASAFYTYSEGCRCTNPTTNPTCASRNPTGGTISYRLTETPAPAMECQRCKSDNSAYYNTCREGLSCVKAGGSTLGACTGTSTDKYYCVRNFYVDVETTAEYKERITVSVEVLETDAWCFPNSQTVDIATGYTTNDNVRYGNKLTSSHEYYNEDSAVECGIRCWNELGVTAFYTVDGGCRCTNPDTNPTCENRASGGNYVHSRISYQLTETPAPATECQRCEMFGDIEGALTYESTRNADSTSDVRAGQQHESGDMPPSDALDGDTTNHDVYNMFHTGVYSDTSKKNWWGVTMNSPTQYLSITIYMRSQYTSLSGGELEVVLSNDRLDNGDNWAVRDGEICHTFTATDGLVLTFTCHGSKVYTNLYVHPTGYADQDDQYFHIPEIELFKGVAVHANQYHNTCGEGLTCMLASGSDFANCKGATINKPYCIQSDNALIKTTYSPAGAHTCVQCPTGKLETCEVGSYANEFIDSRICEKCITVGSTANVESIVAESMAAYKRRIKPEYKILKNREYCSPFTRPPGSGSDAKCGGWYQNHLPDDNIYFDADKVQECASRCWHDVGATAFYTYCRVHNEPNPNRCMCTHPTANEHCLKRGGSYQATSYATVKPALGTRCQRCNPTTSTDQCEYPLQCVESNAANNYLEDCIGNVIGDAYCALVPTAECTECAEGSDNVDNICVGCSDGFYLTHAIETINLEDVQVETRSFDAAVRCSGDADRSCTSGIAPDPDDWTRYRDTNIYIGNTFDLRCDGTTLENVPQTECSGILDYDVVSDADNVDTISPYSLGNNPNHDYSGCSLYMGSTLFWRQPNTDFTSSAHRQVCKYTKKYCEHGLICSGQQVDQCKANVNYVNQCYDLTIELNLQRNKDAEMCMRCPAGKYSEVGSVGIQQCKPCPSTTTATIPACQGYDLCPPGFVGPLNGQRAGGCVQCDGGKYMDETGQMVCKICEAGLYSQDAQPVCLPCAKGKYSAAQETSVCDICAVSKYQDQTGQTGCKNCQSGRYMASEGASACTVCPTGYVSSGGTSATSCGGCTVGKYNQYTGQSGCSNCGVGRYQNSNSQSACKQCPGGWYQNSNGQTGCKECPAGQYQNGNGRTGCYGCTSGTYQNAKRQTSCKNCNAGYYQPANYAQGCAMCTPGKYAGSRASSCTSCPTGRAVGGYGAGGCNSCAPGQYQNSNGQTSCKKCSKGKYQGYYGQSGCKKCSRGKFSRSSGYSRCISCPGGWQNGESGNSRCWWRI